MKNVEIPKWLEELPLAPEFHPTDTEFADPIAYISKIEKEASAFGICKVIPPLPKPSRKYVLHNLNKSLSKCPELGSDVNLVTLSKPGGSSLENCNRTMNGGESRAVFTTRHQELGCEKGKRMKGMVGDQLPRAQKQVWQSGEVYTLEQFEAKSKNFAKSLLGTLKELNPLVIESMFWKSASEKPIYVEYANDVPGSGFGEPEGLLHYFHRGRRRRRRKRNSFDRNNLGSSNSKNNQVDMLKNIIADKDSGSQNTPNLCEQTTTNSFQSVQPNQTAFSGNKNCNGSKEIEGTAGWKLSNSPWNLQVIARSPGSLTRFMPDDIPGVTSPMVYVGMLFSWFAWHVEDHELHSLNYLHMGAPKTWYSVPGEYAFNFEEVIRLHAYGGNTDRLTALSLLGEKTTVLSPEVIVASDIPCCRLVQNPGEFVVTFPRAYHIGYSHGFNCGEAANFGTPKWLSVAKEAAVRRAAMNYLPMLSHQQLLYLLTMSFISRIPRSLLPGARSSRLRDRQKEERELLVKRAFIEDILHENNLLTLLLHRNSTYHAVLWDMESLPSSSKESQFCRDADVVTSTSTEKFNPEIEDNLDHIEQLSQCINAVGFDLNDDDLAYDFQIDSGTLPCVACGILGFPFMTVVQPSAEASKNLLLKNLQATPDLDVLKPVESCFLSDLDHVAAGSVEVDATEKAKSNEKNCSHMNEIPSVAESSQSTHSSLEQSPVPDHFSGFKNQTAASIVEIEKGWNLSNVFLKPRIFCLEHAIEIEELLCSEGGANVLVICHSDFQKIKAHAAVTAEDIAIPFCCNEVPLDTASQDDLNLIGLAIDSEEQVDCAGDWTSLLSINLRHCVKVKKSTPSKKVQHLLNLGGLFSDVTPSPNASSLNWPSRKLRSRRHPKQQLQSKPSDPIEVVEDDLKKKLGHQVVKNEVKIIQYSRRKCKYRSCAGTEAPRGTNSLVMRDILEADREDPNSKTKDRTVSIFVLVANGGDGLSGPSSSVSNGIARLQHDHPVPLSTEGCVQNSSPSHCASPLVTSTRMIEKVETQLGICPSNERVVKGKVGSSWHGSLVHEVELGDENIEKDESHYFENPAGSHAAEKVRCPVAENKTLDEKQITIISVVASNNIVRMAENDLEMPCSIQSDGHGVMKESSEPADSSKSLEVDPPRCDDRMGEAFAYQLVSYGKVSKSPGSDGQPGVQADVDDQEKTVSSFTAIMNESTSAMGSSKKGGTVEFCVDSGKCSSLPENREVDDSNSNVAESKSIIKTGIKRTREEVLSTEDQSLVGGFIKSPCEGLRPRTRKDAHTKGTDDKETVEGTQMVKKLRKASDLSVPRKGKKGNQKGRYKCDLDGCTMSFQTKAELILHKGNRCPVEGCRKKFNSHKYAIQHQRVHDDDRPLKCPWNGCTMSFKWAWARTEHLRVHTGERPYVCKVKECGLTFRFVSDFSRHRRKTGHYVSTSN